MRLTFLFRQKSKQKRRPLVAASLRFAAGNLRCSVKPGSKTTRLRLKRVFALIRLALRSSAHPQGVGKEYRTANSQQPAASSQQPAASSQQPSIKVVMRKTR
jgi:hypothetical protein